MEKYVVGTKKILKKEQVLISIFLISILVLSSGGMVAFAKNNVHVVKPTGVDDTSDIQNALNACVGAGPTCTVQLLTGTYYITSQITVYGFQGSFVGAGQGLTTITVPSGISFPSPGAAYNIPCTLVTPTPSTGPACVPDTGSAFGAGLPGPSNPWPVMFTFFGGVFTISGMTITDPNSVAVSPGYYYYQDPSYTLWTSLYAAVFITGGTPDQPRASAMIDHVTVLGASGDFEGTNIQTAIFYAGTVPQPGASNFFYEILLPGTFSVTNSLFEGVASGPWASAAIDATVTVCYNTFTNDPGPATGFDDVSNTKLTFCGNQFTTPSYGNDIDGFQGLVPTPLLPSTIYITNNNAQVGEGGSAVGLIDFGPTSFGNPDFLNAVVSGNTFQNSYPVESSWYYSVIYSLSLKSTIVSLNNIAGGGQPGIYLNGGPGTIIGNRIAGASTGIWLDAVSGAQVAGNIVTNSLMSGIALTDFNYGGFGTTPSSNNMITGNSVHNSGVCTATQGCDLWWDGLGTGNVFHWNFCTTSQPSGLC